MSNYEVTYEYVVNGIQVVEAETPEQAEDLVKIAVETREPNAMDFEVFSVRTTNAD